MNIKPRINAFLVHLYFSKIALVLLKPLPEKPTLFLALHRNGACDGWVYQNGFVRNRRFPTLTLSIQLVKSFVTRMFFEGIVFVRKKDKGNREQNAQALQSCVDCLSQGQDLIIFPEGSSDLSCKPLPFQRGFAKIIEAFLENHDEICVVPVAVEYTEPAVMGSKVCVVYGNHITLKKGDAAIFETVQQTLFDLAFITDSEEQQQELRALANLAMYENSISYYHALKSFEKSVDPQLLDKFRGYRNKTQHLSLESHLAFYPLRFWQHYPILYTPIILLGFLVNSPCLLISDYVSKKFSDDENVVSFWKILSGTCLFYVYIFTIACVLLFLKKFTLLAGYFVITYLFFTVYGTWKRALKRLLNCLRGWKYQQEFCRLHREVVDAVR